MISSLDGALRVLQISGSKLEHLHTQQYGKPIYKAEVGGVSKGSFESVGLVFSEGTFSVYSRNQQVEPERH